MGKHEFNDKILGQLKSLEAKYDAMGQDLSSYLDGLMHSDYLTYWDYIRLDTLLSLQSTRTSFPDETIFIAYHQITELYFKLILHEQDQLITAGQTNREIFSEKITRINRYFDQLINSFEIMISGMNPKEFLSFRMSLLPASGFQSMQYRLIELGATDFHLLVTHELRDQFSQKDSIEEIYNNLYWKTGATELATGKKTLTLQQFEEKYSGTLLERAEVVRGKTIRQLFIKNFSEDEEIKKLLRTYDKKANVEWPLAHYKSAAKYLQKDPTLIKASGGTNWQKYLPPNKQKISFFPELQSGKEPASLDIKINVS